jgi:hypothetical protein
VVGPNSLDYVSEALNEAKEAISTAPLVGLAFTCVTEAGCAASPAPVIWPVNLGWEAEAELMEDPSAPNTFFVLLVSSKNGGKIVGWEVECTVLGITATDECGAAERIAELTLNGTTLLAVFSEAFNLLAEVKLGMCTLGGAETGIVEGSGPITLNAGGELTASSEGVVS